MPPHFPPQPFFRATAATIAVLAVLGRSLAAESGGHHVLHPAPPGQMREMSTDRPDTTESPITVDAGRFQIEASWFDFSRDEGADAWTFGQMNLKAGLSASTDLQLVLDAWVRESGAEGIGDVTLRLKHNLWGNDGTRTAFALMPYVKIPTGSDVSNDQWEGGLIVPFGINLTERIYLGLMVTLDAVYDDETSDHAFESIHSATLGFALTERLSLYTELAAIAGTESDYRASFDTGLTFAVSQDLILDAGVRLGINDAAEDLGVFTGISIRF